MSKKVLYIGNFLESTGWGLAAQDYILALDSVGIDVVPRPICMGGAKAEVPQRILDLMEKSAEGCEVVIQNVLPHLLRYDGAYKNYSLGFFECDNLAGNSWRDGLNLMDGCIVPTQHNKQTLLNSRVEKPIHVIPCPTDITKYERDYERLPDFPANKFHFYTVGEFTKRKNIPALLRAFHTEFAPYENVELVIKTTPAGLRNPQEEIGKVLHDIKVGLKLHADVSAYRQEKVICDNWSDELMSRLHQSCDCFVSTSFGEGVCRPAVDAMGYGNIAIAPNHTAFPSYIRPYKNSLLYESFKEDCLGAMDTFADLQTSRQQWYYPRVADLREKMRYAFSAYQDKPEYFNGYGEAARFDIKRLFNYNTVGEAFKELLND
jgi:glycosyltransferase involved in cell wall biosynthesis